MKCLEIKFIVLIIKLCIIDWSTSEEEYIRGRFSYKCYENSAVISFRQYGEYKINMFTLVAIYDQDKDTECSRHFSLHEPAIKEFVFKSCAHGSPLFPVIVVEKQPGIRLSHYLSVDCVNNSYFTNS